MQHNWIDISIAISEETFVWPGDPQFQSEYLVNFDSDAVRVSVLRMCAHTGTHMDAPAHYLQGGQSMDQWTADATVGPALVLDLTSAGPRITAEDLAAFEIKPGERVLLRTTNSSQHLYAKSGFSPDFAHLAPEAAAYLASLGVRCVGIDYLSVGGMEDGDETHRLLLGGGVWIIEGLDLRAVQPGDYELVCLPLRIAGIEGAPSRAILAPLHNRSTPEFIEDAVEWASQSG